MKRSKTRDDLRDIFQRSDKRNKRDGDKRRARTFIGDSRSKIKSERGMENSDISGFLYFILCPKFRLLYITLGPSFILLFYRKK